MVLRTFLFLKRNIFVLLLILISILISIANLDKGTWLTGWDTLHHEFNFQLNLGRDIFNGVWRNYQGLGAVAGHSHTSDIPRQLLLLALSYVFPLNFLRYFYIFLTLILGPLGVYFFLKYGIFNFHKSDNTSNIIKEYASFFGGLFYILNLGTLQQFYVPFEMFNAAYAFIPYLYLYSLLFLKHGGRKNYILLIFTMICALPMSYAATLSYLTYLFLGLFIVSYYLLNFNHSKNIMFKRLILVFFSILVVNSYWFLPNIYFVINYGSSVSNAKINYLFSEEAFLNNKKYGSIFDLALLRNFLFGWKFMSPDKSIQDLMYVWNSYLQNYKSFYVGYLFFIFSLFGVFISVLKKNKEAKSLILPLLLGSFFLLNSNPPLGFLFDYLRNNISFFKEALRFPFTKVSPTQIFLYATFVGYFLYYFYSLLNKRLFHIIATLVLSVSLIFYMFPMFKGYLISPSLRLSIPQYYFDMFEWFKTQDSTGRVALFPINSHAGWIYYDWGYQGSGFLQFGIQQPILDRDFDRWNLSNEQYYREMSFAVYSKNIDLLDSIIEKYNIKYLVLDRSVIDPTQGPNALFLDELEHLLSNSKLISGSKDFGTTLKPLISVYFVDNQKTKDYLQLLNTGDLKFLTNAPYNTVTTRDEYYLQYKDYLSLNSSSNFSFESPRELINSNLLRLKIPSDKLLSFYNKEYMLPVSVYYRVIGTNLEVMLLPSFFEVSAVFNTPTYIFSDVIINDSTKFILSFGKNTVPIEILTNSNEFVFGNTLVLDKTSSNFISLYKIPTSNLVDMDLRNITVTNYCSTSKNLSSYSLDKFDNGFNLSGDGFTPCLYYPVSSELLGRSFLYFSISGSNSYCFGTKTSCNYYYPGVELENSFDMAYLRFFVNSTSLDNSASFTSIRYINVNPVNSVPLNLYNIYSKPYDKDFTLLPFFQKTSNIDITESLTECSTSIKTNKLSSYFDMDGKKIFKLESLEGNGCLDLKLGSINSGRSFVIGVNSRNLSGLPIRICVKDLKLNKCVLESTFNATNDFSMEYFLVPPYYAQEGYSLLLYNYSIGSYPAINEISSLDWFYFPYDFLKQLSVDSINTYSSSDSVLYLDTAFDKGWLAICGRELCNAEHVVFNNWANAWVFKGKVPEDITIVFWPQYLQYFGYLLLLVPIYIVFKLPSSKKHIVKHETHGPHTH